MQKFIPKACLTLMSLTLLASVAIGGETNTKISYLESVSNSYLHNQSDNGSRILNMNSDEAQGFEASFKLDAKQNITNSHAKINLSLRDSDVRQVLRMLADKAGINIVFDFSIEGKISLDLNNVDINDAFMIIFKTLRYAYTFEDNTLTVMTVETYQKMPYSKKKKRRK